MTPLHAQAQNVTQASSTSESTTPAASTTPKDNSDAVQQLGTVTVVGTVNDLSGLNFLAPNSSTTISDQDIEAMGATKLDQALQYQAGVLSEPFGPDNKVDWFKIRGFDASVSIDGTPTTPNGYFVWKPEAFGLESVEVLKGPNSLVFGASQAGGGVNLVTKRPHKDRSLQMNADVGSRNRTGLSLDYNDIANEEGNVYYRIVAQARREDGMQDSTYTKNYYFAPSVTFDFTDRASLTLLTSIQRDEGRPTNGFLPAYGTLLGTRYGTIDPHLNAGEPGFDYLGRTQTTAGWLFTYKLTPDWTYTQNYKYSHLALDQQNVFAYGSDGNRELLRGYTYTQGATNNNYIDNRITGNIRLGQHVRILPTVGMDYLKSRTSGQNNGFGAAPNLDMFSPIYGVPFPVTSTPYDLSSRQLGLYASTQVKVGSHWNFNAGIRNDHASNDGAINRADAGYDVSHNSLNLGAMYISDYGASPYISYSESFQPIAGVDAAGNTYKPYEGKQTEFGIKFDPDWLNGTVTIAHFQVEEKNALISNASNIQTQSGHRANQGIELQGDFRLWAGAKMKATYTYNHSRQDISDNRTIRTPLIPRNQASLLVSQRLKVPHGKGLTVSAGVRYNGSTEDQQYAPGDIIPSYTLLDLMARYEIDRNWAVQVNARNVTNRTYVSACDFYCYYGSGRTLDMQLQYQWH
ncbi:MAG TPA: TonB-dependent siderophore receptor [Castellaniella sp.]|uniref:TonB-dependent siderophore receptor n=1 Tax=Castellaniella sp. TaxID=1955812 RepID=UPI002EDD7217